ncbi:MAG: hypothetical protein JNK48_32470 [Bryobacterales bacterium]|nr:hypothetical protein [Bryobacterales bacterium]
MRGNCAATWKRLRPPGSLRCSTCAPRLWLDRSTARRVRWHGQWERNFLGFSFTANREPKRRIAPKAVQRFKERVRELTRRTRGISIERMAQELNRYLRGWIDWCSMSEQRCIEFMREAVRDLRDLCTKFDNLDPTVMEELESAEVFVRSSSSGRKFLTVREAAREIGFETEFLKYNKELSKLAHPTALFLFLFSKKRSGKRNESLDAVWRERSFAMGS